MKRGISFLQRASIVASERLAVVAMEHQLHPFLTEGNFFLIPNSVADGKSVHPNWGEAYEA